MLGRIVEFLVSTLADLLAFVLLLRLFMQATRTSFANPLGEIVIALSNWIVRPLRRALPPLGPIDSASLLPAWLAQWLALVLILVTRGADLPMVPLLWVALVETLRIAVWVWVIALLAMAIISWVNPYSPFASPIAQLTRPILRPIQRVMPTVGRLDLSPLVAILLLQVLLIVLDGLR
ncbi:MAG TPA: YggT family protein [Rhodocyclaceae bacterium]